MEAFSDEERDWIAYVRKHSNPEEGVALFRGWRVERQKFLAAIDARDQLLEIMRADGSEATDYARRVERASAAADVRESAKGFLNRARTFAGWEVARVLEALADHIEATHLEGKEA